MNKTLIAGLILGLSLSSNSYASLACDELLELRDDISQLADAVEDSFTISREEDELLSDIVDVNFAIADEEGDNKLRRATERMENAWVNEDKDAYVDALDDVSDRLDSLFVRDC